MSRKTTTSPSSSSQSLSQGERLLLALAESLDVDKSIEKLNISRDEASKLLRGFVRPKESLSRIALSKSRVSKKTATAGKISSSKAKSAVYELYVDGGSRGNPGPSGAGAVIKGPDGAVVKRLTKGLGVGTNNRAEYMALIMGLEEALKLGGRRIKILADSELMVRQISGRYKVKSPVLKPLYERAMLLRASFSAFTISHIPRALNSEADALANEAMDKIR